MTVYLADLRDAGPDAVADFLAGVDAEGLVAAIHAASDDELRRLLAHGDVRQAALHGLLSRLHEYAVPERLARVTGVVRVELVERRQRPTSGTLRIAGGEVVADDAGTADVVLRTDPVRFVRVVSGELNAGLEFLRGSLDIEGDADLALAVGGIFRVPGAAGVAVDPRELDPVDVATVLGEVKGSHLERVMRSEFRDVVLGEVFRRLPEFVDPQKAAGVRLAVAFRLTGRPDGAVERYLVVVDDGVATVRPGDVEAGRDATVTCEAHDFLRLATGHLNPVVGVLRGKLKVKGDQARALQLSSVFDIPRAG